MKQDNNGLTWKTHDFLQKVMKFAKEKHNGQLDDSGNDYFQAHVAQVVLILSKVTNDKDILASAYLHDTLEDTNTTLEELDTTFGSKIANLVVELTKVKQIGIEHSNCFPNLKSKEAIMIKFADRLSNLSRLDNCSKEKQRRILKKSKFWIS